MNEYSKLAIRERINTLEAERINLSRLTVWTPPRDPLAQKSIDNIDDEIADLREDLDESEEDGSEDGDRTLGTYYVNIEPNVDKVREVLEELSRIDTSKLKCS